MRAVLGILILIAGFGLVAKLHHDRIERDRALRDRAWEGGGRPEAVDWKEPLPDGWTRLVLGSPARAAGAQLDTNIPLPDWRDLEAARARVDLVPGDAPAPLRDAEPAFAAPEPERARPAPGLPVDFEHEVRAGQTLSEICQRFYGSAGARLVGAVARYNGIDADQLEVGQRLLLPERSLLGLEE